MSDYLANLVSRTLDPAAVTPRLPSLFEPLPAGRDFPPALFAAEDGPGASLPAKTPTEALTPHGPGVMQLWGPTSDTLERAWQRSAAAAGPPTAPHPYGSAGQPPLDTACLPGKPQAAIEGLRSAPLHRDGPAGHPVEAPAAPPATPRNGRSPSSREFNRPAPQEADPVITPAPHLQQGRTAASLTSVADTAAAVPVTVTENLREQAAYLPSAATESGAAPSAASFENRPGQKATAPIPSTEAAAATPFASVEDQTSQALNPRTASIEPAAAALITERPARPALPRIPVAEAALATPPAFIDDWPRHAAQPPTAAPDAIAGIPSAPGKGVREWPVHPLIVAAEDAVAPLHTASGGRRERSAHPLITASEDAVAPMRAYGEDWPGRVVNSGPFVAAVDVPFVLGEAWQGRAADSPTVTARTIATTLAALAKRDRPGAAPSYAPARDFGDVAKTGAKSSARGETTAGIAGAARVTQPGADTRAAIANTARAAVREREDRDSLYVAPANVLPAAALVATPSVDAIETSVVDESLATTAGPRPVATAHLPAVPRTAPPDRSGGARPSTFEQLGSVVAMPPADAAPTIQVTIGRIEVRAAQPPQRRSDHRQPAPSATGLDEYLRRRNGGGS